MSQSKEHERLIHGTVEALTRRYVGINVVCDIQEQPGDTIPPLIGGFRPDIHAVYERSLIVIAEAKTDKDIDCKHTDNQIISFIEHLDKSGLFVLSVNGHKADLAKTILILLKKYPEIARSKSEIEVFDTLDFWRLNEKGQWHLN